MYIGSVYLTLLPLEDYIEGPFHTCALVLFLQDGMRWLCKQVCTYTTNGRLLHQHPLMNTSTFHILTNLHRK